MKRGGPRRNRPSVNQSLVGPGAWSGYGNLIFSIKSETGRGSAFDVVGMDKSSTLEKRQVEESAGGPRSDRPSCASSGTPY